MKIEESCGAVVYRKNNNKIEYLLLLQSFSGTWSFPKGHMEQGETRQQTALREAFEEASLNLELDQELKNFVSYTLNNGNKKYVYLFPAEFSGEVNVNNNEISTFKWVEKSEALELLPKVGYGDVFEELEKRIKSKEENNDTINNNPTSNTANI